jgi:hypothetical protein
MIEGTLEEERRNARIEPHLDETLAEYSRAYKVFHEYNVVHPDPGVPTSSRQYLHCPSVIRASVTEILC